jgi:predicted acetyltransferase
VSADEVLVSVVEADKSVLANLLQLYRHDLSEFRPYEVSDHGCFTYRFLDQYWTEPGRHPFFIRHAGQLAGFAMVRQSAPGTHEIAEFFVVRRHRGTGLGRAAAVDVLRRFAGSWRVFHDDTNTTAGRFWARILTEVSSGGLEQRAVVTSAGYAGQEYRFEVT